MAERGAEAAGAQGSARPALVASCVTAAVALSLLLWYAADVLLLVFAAVLLAIGLRSLSNVVSRATKLSGGWSLALVTLSLLAAFAAGGCCSRRGSRHRWTS